MKKCKTMVAALFLFLGGTAFAQNEFISTWQTDNVGASSSTEITLPTNGAGYSYDVDWDNDGTFDELGLTGDVTHDFVTAGTYTIRIQGTFPSIYFNNGGDRQKLVSVDQWGTIAWEDMTAAFWGCSNMNVLATDAPDLSNVTEMGTMFRNCAVLDADLNAWDVSNVQSFIGTFRNCPLFNSPLNNWVTTSATQMRLTFAECDVFNQDVSNFTTTTVTDMDNMFQDALVFDQDLSAWNVTGLLTADGMFDGATLSIANYDALFIAWDAQTLQANVVFDGGNSMYCNAIAARANMIATDTWTITDGGVETIAPVPAVASLADVTAECEVTALVAPTAEDACTGTITGVADVSGPFTTQGTTVVTWTFTDGNGNIATETQNVIILDITAPTPDAGSLSDVLGTCEVTALVPPTAADNCLGTVTVSNDINLPIIAQGTTVVTWSYTDENGNVSTQLQNVILDDATAPAFDLASLPVVNGTCSVASLVAPTATDLCVGAITGTHNASFPITTEGTTTVTWTYDDGNGNTSTQDQDVIIADDVTDPVFDVASLSDVTVECSAINLVAPTATDVCSGVITGTTMTSLPITTIGTTTITWSYDDGNGNVVTQDQDIIVTVDVTGPVADEASLADVTAECSVVSIVAPTATDGCSATVVMGTTSTSFPIDAQGTTTVVWTYTDGLGNTSTQSQDVVIADVTAPALVTLADVTAECKVIALIPPTVTDNCGGVVTITNNSMLPITAQGTTVVTWTYTDENGNVSTEDQNIVIDDVTVPTPDAGSLSDVLGTCSVANLVDPTATDNCVGVVTVSNDASLPITAEGTTVVTWSYEDESGNVSTQVQNVIISDDVVAPALDVASLSDISELCAVTALVPPTATDVCSGVITGTHNATLPIIAEGTTTITWSYDDGNGNITTQDQDVIIADDVTAPVEDVASLADVNLDCDVTSLVAPTATDDCVGTVTGTTTTSLPITFIGTTTITWTYDDGKGNTTTQDQDVVITADATAPVADLTSLADVTGDCSVTALVAPTATDACSSVTVTSNAMLPYTTQGTTTITWTYTDENGNFSTQDQDIVVNDVTAPVATLASLDDVLGTCSVASLIAPTATDACSGAAIVTSDASLPITAEGTTVVTWSYEDASGNVSTQTQNVIISDDVTAPVVSAGSLSDLNDLCAVTALVAPTATDDCLGLIDGTHNASLPIEAEGTTVVTWTYDDGNGNVTTQDQNVIIADDVTAPIPAVASLDDILSACEVTALVAPTATDNCATTVIVTSDASLPYTTEGTFVITWTYDDGKGNTTTQTQNVIIDDVTAPVATAGSLADVVSECDVTSLTAPAATDECTATVIITSDASFPISFVGTTVITWSYDDGHGNVATQAQNVIVSGDVTDPTASNPTSISVQCAGSIPNADINFVTDEADNCTTPVVTYVGDVSDGQTCPETITRTYNVADAAGNSIDVEQTITINDVSAPTADSTTLADVSDICSVTPVTPTATDNCIGSVDGTADVTFPITTIGTTLVTWTYIDDCGNTSTQTQNVIILAIDVTTTVASNNVTISANNTNGTYQWIDCDDNNAVITGETSIDYTPTVDGNYAVIVTEAGCTETSACVNIAATGLGEISSISIALYPNPTINGVFTVDFDGVLNDIVVVDMLGRAIELPTNLETGVVNGSTLESGKYFVRIFANDQTITKEIVVIK